MIYILKIIFILNFAHTKVLATEHSENLLTELFFSSEHLPPQMNELPQQMPKGSVLGLHNLGNTCYANALTVMIATTKLSKILNPTAKIAQTKKTDEIKNTFKLRKEMSSLVSGMVNRLETFHLKRTRSYIKTLNQCFSELMEASLYQQHDPAELYNHIMNQLDSDINSIETNVTYTTTKDQSNEVTSYSLKEKIINIPLIVKSKKLQNHINRIFEPEITEAELDGKKIIYKKHTRINKAPETLVLQLGRFQGVWGEEKSKRVIKIPMTIELSTYKKSPYEPTTGMARKIKYHLKSAVLHKGTTTQNGHYTAYSFHGGSKNKKIIQYDDHRISEITDLNDLYKNAYIVAYEK